VKLLTNWAKHFNCHQLYQLLRDFQAYRCNFSFTYWLWWHTGLVCLVCGCTSWVDTWLAVLAEEFLVFTKVCWVTSWILARFSASIALPVSTMLRENVWLEVCLPCCPVATWLARKLAFLMGYHMTLQVGCTQAYTTFLSVILKANLGIF